MRTRIAAAADRRRCGRRPAVIACVLLLAGCASMPSSGRVRDASDVGAGQEPAAGSDIRVIARPPQDGMSPEQIVRGFLEAMNSVEPDFSTAKLYLAEPDSWMPEQRVAVYDAASLEVNGDESGASIAGTKIGEIGEDGGYRAVGTTSDRDLRQRFSVVEDPQGELRIENPPDGVLVSDLDFQREYVGGGSFDLFFFDPQFEILVPDPIYLPRRHPDLITALTQAVLRGPTARLAGAVENAVPKGTGLATTPVPVANGLITVALDEKASGLPAAQREYLTAQLVWTLSAVRRGNDIVVTAAGQALSAPTTSADWTKYRSTTPTARSGYLLQDQVLTTFGTGPDAKPAPALAPGQDAEPVLLSSYAVSPENGDIAGITDRTRLLSFPRAGPREPRELMAGTELESPTWDAFGRLWVLDQTDSGTEVHYFDENEQRHSVDVVGLENQRVAKISVSGDGTRIALLVGPARNVAHLYLGRVVGPDSGSEDAPPRGAQSVSVTMFDVAPQLGRAVDVAWVDADELVALIETNEVVQPYRLGVDGQLVEPLALPVEAKSIAAAPNSPILVGTVDQEIWRRDRFWEPLSIKGEDPAYPG